MVSSMSKVKSYVKDLRLSVIDDNHLDVDSRLSLSVPIKGEVSVNLRLTMHILDFSYTPKTDIAE